MIAATATHIGFFVAAGGWIAMFIVTLFLPRRGSSPEQQSVIRELATGFRFIRGHRVLLVLMGFEWIGLLPAYVDQLGGSAREVGFVFSSVGIGGLWTGALAAAIGLRAGMMVGRWFFSSLFSRYSQPRGKFENCTKTLCWTGDRFGLRI